MPGGDGGTDATLMSTTRLSPHPRPIRPYPLKKKFRTKGGGPPLRHPRVPQKTTSASVIGRDHEYTKGSFISTRATKRMGKKFHWTPRESRSRSQSRTTFPIYSSECHPQLSSTTPARLGSATNQFGDMLLLQQQEEEEETTQIVASSAPTHPEPFSSSSSDLSLC